MINFSNPKLGVWSLIDSFHALQILLHSEIDFIVFDFEHGYWRREQLATAVSLCKNAGKNAVVRIPNPSQEWIQLAYDSCSDIIQIAGVRSQSDIDGIATLVQSPPLGSLGFSPWTPQGYMSKTNPNSFPQISIQIEDVLLLKSFIDGNLKFYSGVSSVFVGRYDLSVSMGIPGEIDNKEILKMIGLACSKKSALNVSIGTVSNSISDFQALKDLGIDFVSLGSDVQRLSDKI
jgi:2-keto-3-deoxy-L-rhamnonate aldolase RhmA